MSSPLYGPLPTIALKFLRFGFAGSVAWKNSASDEKVLPGGIAAGRKNTPLLKLSTNGCGGRSRFASRKLYRIVNVLALLTFQSSFASSLLLSVRLVYPS